MVLRLLSIVLIFILFSCAHNNKNDAGFGNAMNNKNEVSRYAKILENVDVGKTYSTTTASGKDVSFTVTDYYMSASGRSCKKFEVNSINKLACKKQNVGEWMEAKAFR